MAENDAPAPGADEPTEAPVAETAEQTAVTEAPTAVGASGTRFTDRLWHFRAVVAVALAALLLGGGIGAAIAAVTHDDGPDRHLRFTRFEDGPGGGQFPGPPDGFGPGRQQLRKDLQDMRKEFRQKMRQQQRDDRDAPGTPSPSPSPSSKG